MIRRLAGFLLLAVCLATGLHAEEARLTAAEASNHVDERATVCGIVASTRFSPTAQGRPTFLNLDKPYPDHIFTIVIWGDKREAFGKPEEKYRNRRLCVTGLIESYQGSAQIVATQVSQITFDADSSTKKKEFAQSDGLSDAEIRKILIRQSIARYSGSCPCPYNRDRAGRRCGGRSAYSRPGGASPLCYDGDVTDKMIATYRSTHQ